MYLCVERIDFTDVRLRLSQGIMFIVAENTVSVFIFIYRNRRQILAENFKLKENLIV